MSDASYDRSRCSVAGTLAVVGEKWSLLLLREAFLGVRRFADFQQALGAPKAVLTDRLATLVQEGLLGALFAVLVIYIFLRSARTTLVAAISIPTAVISPALNRRVR